MNSMSKGNCQVEKGCGCKKEKEKESEVLLKCKPANSVLVTATTTLAGPTRIADLSLNTKNLSDPCIKFEFATNLISTFATGATLVTVNFQLNKLCKGQVTPTTVGGQWIFTRGASTSDIVSFIVCDCDCDCDCDKNDCCTYFVSVTYIATGGSVALTFNNTALSALVVERTKRC